MKFRSREDGSKHPLSRGSLYDNRVSNKTFQRDIHFADETQARNSVTFADRYWEEHPGHHARSRLVLAMNEARNKARVGATAKSPDGSFKNSETQRREYGQADRILTAWVDAHKGRE